jgi:hypothetical protein
MMFSWFRDAIQAKLLALYTRRLTKAAYQGIIHQEQGNPAGMGLLYTYDPANPTKTDAVVQVVKRLQAAGKQVQVLCYVPHHKALATNTPFATVTKKDINLLGRSQNESFNSFVKSSFDYLYHLDLISDAVLDYVVAKCTAHCKIGNYLAGREALFELMFKDLVQPDKEVSFDSLIGKMFNYTQLLKV